jgi:hypothetical protein
LLFGEYKNGVLVSRTRSFKVTVLCPLYLMISLPHQQIDKSEDEFATEKEEVNNQNSYHGLLFPSFPCEELFIIPVTDLKVAGLKALLKERNLPVTLLT